MKNTLPALFMTQPTKLVLMILLFTGHASCGQHVNDGTLKTITVIGSAEMNVVPDQVELNISMVTQRNDHEKHEKELIEICQKHGIPSSQLNFKNALGFNDWYYWYWWWYYRNSSTVEQTYKLKISNSIDFLAFVKDLNKNWVRNISIVSSTHKEMTEYRKDVKKQAMRMAKEKATYMLEAVDEKLGSIITVEEINADIQKENKQAQRYPYHWYWDNPYYLNQGASLNNGQIGSNSVMSSGGSGGSGDDGAQDNGIGGLSSIKLRYEVKVVFSIR